MCRHRKTHQQQKNKTARRWCDGCDGMDHIMKDFCSDGGSMFDCRNMMRNIMHNTIKNNDFCDRQSKPCW